MSAESSWLLVVAGDSLLRVELKGDGGVGAARVFLRRGETVGKASAPVLETLPRRAGVWVWLADAWCQTLTVGALPEGDEGGRTARLAYEAEPFSGLRPEEAYTAGEAGAGGRVWRIFQAPRKDVDSLLAAAREARCRLLGVGHPAQLAAVAGADGLPAADPTPFAAEDCERLASEWWARAREGRLPPLLPPEAARRGAGEGKDAKKWLFWGGLAVLLAVLAAGASAEKRAGALGEENAVLQGLAAEAGRTEREAEGLRRQKEALWEEYRAGLEPRRRLQALRGRTAALYAALDGVSEGAGGRWMLRGVRSPEPFTHEVELWAGSQKDAEDVLSAMAEKLAGAGLAVFPEETEALMKLEDGGPWRVVFEVAPGAGEEVR